jgi:preprotein translocase subunit SecG
VSILITILLALWVLVALLMMLVILMQRPKSEGLGAAFGGAVTENLFGAQTTNVLVKFTAWLAGFFFVVTFVLSVLYAHRSMGGSSLSRELKKTSSVPAAASQRSPASSPAAASPASNSAVGVVPAGSAPPAGVTSPAAAVATGAPQQKTAASPASTQQPKP